MMINVGYLPKGYPRETTRKTQNNNVTSFNHFLISQKTVGDKQKATVRLTNRITRQFLHKSTWHLGPEP